MPIYSLYYVNNCTSDTWADVMKTDGKTQRKYEILERGSISKKERLRFKS